MANPIQTAKELQKLLKSVLDSITMAQKPREKVFAALERTNETVTILEDIHANYVPLDIKNGGSNLSENLECWKMAASGVLREGTSGYQELISKSETLKALHATGIDIPSIAKFSDEEIKFAKRLGNRFLELHDLLYRFTACLNHSPGKGGRIHSKVPNAALDEIFFGMLKEYKVIDEYKVSLYLFKTGTYVDSDFPKLVKLNGKTNKTLIDFTFGNSQHHDLIRGHWFNAYAYHVIDDHLERNHFDYEIYTRVSYTAPADIIRSGGDFDIIAMVGSKVLLVECKSGELKKEPDRDDFVKIIEKTEGIKKVFNYTKTDYYDYVFLLIYNHFANKPDEISKHLEGTGITPVKPDQIRGAVIELFRK